MFFTTNPLCLQEKKMMQVIASSSEHKMGNKWNKCGQTNE